MKTVTVRASKEYPVLIEHGILKNCGEIIKNYTKASSFAVITDDVVDKLYADTLIEALNEVGFKAVKYVFPHGEESKCMENLCKIYDFLCKDSITRTDCLIALGGGVTGDITGFAAATYLRGLDYVQIPTTLLAQIDSSVGGKTAVNLPCGKNLAGAFKQPSCVICDPDTLSTLSDEILSDGMAEAIKYGMIKDENLFDIIYSHDLSNIRSCLDDIVYMCVSIKKDVVEGDEFDTGNRMILNFGHTLGHAIEKLSNFEYTHGSAIAAGMCMITECAQKHGLCSKDIAQKLTECVKKYALPCGCEFAADDMVKICGGDKKRESDSMNFILCDKIGHSIIKRVPFDEFVSFICK